MEVENDFNDAGPSMDDDPEILEDPFTYAAGAVDEAERGLDREIKTYDARYNSKGERILLQVGKKKEWHEDRDRDFSSALVLIRFFSPEMQFVGSDLCIQSPHMRQALRDTILEYPGLDLTSSRLLLPGTPWCIFHYRKELKRYAASVEDPTAREHVEFLLEYASRVLKKSIDSFNNLMGTSSTAPGLHFHDLWMAFRPGDLVFTKTNDVPQVMRLRGMEHQHVSHCPVEERWLVKCEIIQYDGVDFGFTRTYEKISEYKDWVPLKELPVYPLQYHPEKDAVMDEVLQRGKKYVSLKGVHYMHYDGVAEALSPSRRNTVFGEEDDYPIQSMSVKGRVIIDPKTFEKARPSHVIDWIAGRKKYNVAREEHLQLQDDEIMICSHSLSGYSLSTKRWCYFDIKHLQEIEFNADAFEKLILPSKQKEMVHSLVKIHVNHRLSFDDVIRGKGKGIVFLLHGAPGVGKTLTAESVADYTRRPLYVIGCGDLGSDASSVEEALSSILQLSLQWNAILLLDEADVFLEQRTSHDMERNGVVSVFLRMLEYFEGIMFLTSNRIQSIDKAFKSRIHLAIHYPALSFEARRELWKMFITRGASGANFWWDDEHLDYLASHELNGRQIKNAVHTAHALAVSEGESLNAAHIGMSLDAIITFDAEMSGESIGT